MELPRFFDGTMRVCPFLVLPCFVFHGISTVLLWCARGDGFRATAWIPMVDMLRDRGTVGLLGQTLPNIVTLPFCYCFCLFAISCPSWVKTTN